PEPNDVLGFVGTGDPAPALLVPPTGAQVVGFVSDPFGDRHRSPAFPFAPAALPTRPCGITKPPGVAGRSVARDGPRDRGAGQLATLLNGRSIIELILPDAKGSGQPVRRSSVVPPPTSTRYGMIFAIGSSRMSV